jgi:phage shock protein C
MEDTMTKKLYRSRTERMIAGVCGGLAEYFEIDSTLVRLIAIALTLAGGSGVLAYIIFWFVVPQKTLAESMTEGEPANNTETKIDDSISNENNSSMVLAGTILLVVGFTFLVGNFISFAWLSFRKLWPLALIAIGIFILLKGSGSKTHEN